MKIFLLALALVGGVVRSALAYETRLSLDPTASLEQLAGISDLSQLPVSVNHDGKFYTLDASAVLTGVDLAKLYAASVAYDHYVEFGMPDLRESLIVERGPGDLLYTWTHMATLGQNSQHYLEVHVAPALATPGARATEWELVPQRAPWTYPDQPGFDRFYGSWYMQPMPSGQIYVRYFMAAAIRTGLPEVLVNLFAQGRLKYNVRQAIHILAGQAKSP